MADAQEVFDLGLGRDRGLARDGRDVDGAQEFGLLDALHAGRVGDANLVVAAAEAGRLALGFEHADDDEGNPLDADGLAQGILGVEEVRLDVGAQDANLGRRTDRGFVEEGARFDVPLANHGILVAAALNRGVPVLGGVDDLGAGADAGRDGLDRGTAVGNGLGVLGPQRLVAAETGADALGVPAGPADEEEVGTHGAEAGLDGGLGPGPDGNHGDDRPDPDDDAQAGQEGPHLVAGQGPQRDAQDAQGLGDGMHVS